MDFKVSYLDAGLTNSYFSDSEQLSGSLSTAATASSGSGSVASTGQTQSSSQPRRRYKTHLRDFLSTCRTKRKLSASAAAPTQTVATTVTVDYSAAIQAPPVPAAPPPTVADVLYTNLNTAALYSAGPYNGAVAADNSGYHQTNFHQSLYDTRIPYLTATDNLFQYR